MENIFWNGVSCDTKIRHLLEVDHRGFPEDPSLLLASANPTKSKPLLAGSRSLKILKHQCWAPNVHEGFAKAARKLESFRGLRRNKSSGSCPHSYAFLSILVAYETEQPEWSRNRKAGRLVLTKYLSDLQPIHLICPKSVGFDHIWLPFTSSPWNRQRILVTRPRPSMPGPQSGC